MRGLILIVVLTVAACAEGVHGPRQVFYAPDRFYIRHAPTTSDQTAAAIADETCQRRGKRTTLVRSAQFFPVDVRDADYACVPP